MVLGSKCQLTIGTLSLESSLEFYTKLGFRVVARGEQPYNWCKITDDSLLALLYENGNNYLGITYFDKNIRSRMEVITDLNIPLVQNAPSEKIFISKEDLIVTLSQSNDTETMVNITLAAEEYLSGGRKEFPLKNETLGTFGELAVHVGNVSQSKEYWDELGFRKIHFTEKPYRRMLITDDLFNLGLHENSKMSDQSIVYYTTDIEATKEQLRKKGIAFSDEHFEWWNHQHAIHIRTPEQQHLYIATI